MCFLSQLEWNVRDLTQKKAGFPCSGLNLGFCFTSQDEGLSESPVETLEKAVGLRLIWTGGHRSLDTSRGLWSLRLQKVSRLESS